MAPLMPLLLALLAGAAMPLAFAPVSWGALAPLSLAALFRLLDGAAPRRAALLGLGYGLGMMGVGVSWVQVSIHQFGLPVYAFSVGVTLLLIALLACFPALAAWLHARLRPAGALGAAAVFAGCWTLVEWLRGWLLTGFPWLYAGYAQIDNPLGAYAPVGGVLLVTLLSAFLGALLVTVLRRGDWRSRTAAGALIAAVLGGGLALAGHAWTRPAGPPLAAALVQGNIEQHRKWTREQRDPTMALYRQLTEPHWGAALIVWPETAIPAFPEEIPEYLGELAARGAAAGSTLLIGLPTLFGERAYRNSVLALGAHPGQYDKRHLVPFGEYLPLKSLLGGILDFLRIPMSDFSSGARVQVPIRVAGHELGISICYEDAFAGEVRKALPGAALLVNVSNDAWFGDSLAPHQHLQIARMRAREFGRYLLRATNTGVSAVIDHRGTVIATIAQFQAATAAAEVVPMRGATPFARWGEAPLLLLLGALLGARAVLARRSPAARSRFRAAGR